MARDEALLLAVENGACDAALRLYGWSAPTVSLGAFQRFDELTALPASLKRLSVVRRPTGGGAILHDMELTYCLVLPRKLLPRAGAGHLYLLVHDAIAEALRSVGINAALRQPPAGKDSAAARALSQRGQFWCFARQYSFDVLANGLKIAGSAQKRTAAAVLQHGSIILANRFGEHPAADLNRYETSTLDRLAEHLAAAICRRLSLHAEPDRWQPQEISIAARISEKYNSQAWLRRR